MKSGRKNLKRASKEEIPTLLKGQSIMKVVSLLGSNQIQINMWKVVSFAMWNSIKRLTLDNLSFRKLALGGTHQHVLRCRLSCQVIDAEGQKSVALFPAKFQKCMWIRQGSFVVVDDSGKEKALESGSKVACLVLQVLFYEQVHALRKSTEWPEIFKTAVPNDSKCYMQTATSNPEELNSSDSDDLAPLEGNLNRTRPIELYSDSDSDAES